MEKYIYNKQSGLHYELVGDYYLPLLTVPEAPPLGIWGRRRHRYLKEHRPVIYNTMLSVRRTVLPFVRSRSASPGAT